MSIKRFALFGLLLVSAFAANAGSAMADISPASTAITATSGDSQLTYSGTTISCTIADAVGTTPARGTSALSVVLTFGTGGRCRAFGVPATVTCSGRATLRQTAFAAGSGSGTVDLDTGFNCTVNVTSAGCTVTVAGPQTNVGTWDFTNANQTLRNTATNVRATDSGGICNGTTATRSGRGTGTFTGRYRATKVLTDS